MTKEEFNKKYTEFLQKHSDKNRAEKEKAYLYSDLKHYGLNTSQRRNYIKKHKSLLTNLKKKEMLEWVKYFWSLPSFEQRMLALEILNLHLNELNISDMPLIEKLMRESKGWAFLDNLIIPVMPVILEKDKKAYKYLKKWIKDEDYWVRRSALLAQLLFFRYDSGGDRDLFFELSQSQFDESWIEEIYEDTQSKKRARFFIRKAIGWTLREMSLKQPKIVRQFLKENKENMSGLSYREGSRKLLS